MFGKFRLQFRQCRRNPGIFTRRILHAHFESQQKPRAQPKSIVFSQWQIIFSDIRFSIKLPRVIESLVSMARARANTSTRLAEKLIFYGTEYMNIRAAGENEMVRKYCVDSLRVGWCIMVMAEELWKF